MSEAEDETWHIGRREYDAEGEDWQESFYPAIPGADLATTQATALEIYLGENPEASASTTSWHEAFDGWCELHHAGEETGFYVSTMGGVAGVASCP